nr:hypothetical protein [Tanacetum cinerariifolium]
MWNTVNSSGPLWKDGSPLFDSSPKISGDARKKHDEVLEKESGASTKLNSVEILNTEYPDDPKMHGLETIILVDFPKGKKAIGTKWVFMNKKDEKGIVIKNKARIEAIRLFLDYTLFMRFMVYQMDMKSAFLYGRIEEEVYVCQPLGFKDPNHPNKVYKVVKALYGLHQAPRAWYKTLAKYPLGNGFYRGKIDQNLFIKRQKGDILLVQVYVDDIIFGSTKELWLQVKQKEDGIFISQDKYVAEVLRKFNFLDVKSASTQVDMEKTLVKHADGNDVDVHLYRSMIGSLMYLIASKPDVMYACKKQNVVTTSITEAEYVAATSCCGQFWQTTTARTLDIGDMEMTATIDRKVNVVTEASVRRHLKLEDSDGISNLPTTKIFEQLALMDSNIATALIFLATNRKFNFSKLIFDGMGEGSIVPIESHHTPIGAPSTLRPHLSPTPRSSIRQETEVPQSSSPPHSNVAGEAVLIGVDVRHGGAVTTVTSLDAGESSGNINKTPSKPHDSLLPRVHTLGSDDGRMQHNELMDLVTKLSNRVVALETDLKQTKKVYSSAYTKLIMKGRYDQDIDFNLDFDTAKEFSTAEKEVSTVKPASTAGAAVTTASVDVSPTPTRRVSTADDITMAEILVYIRKSAAKDKGKGIMTKSEPVQTKTNLQQEQKRLGYEAAVRLQEELDEEERQRMTKVHQATQSFTEEEWENIRARQLRGYSFDELKTLFETTMRRVNTFVPMESEVDRVVSEFAARSLKSGAEEELDQGSSKRKKTSESSKLAEASRDNDANELSQEDLQQMVIIRMYDTCGVHNVSTKDEVDIYMLVEKEYPLSIGVFTQMLGARLLVEQDNDMSKELLRKIFMHVERPRR